MAYEKMLRDCPRVTNTLEMYVHFYSNRLLDTFKEVAKSSEFSLNNLLERKFEEELFVILMIQSPLMKDMALTTLTADLAKSAFKLFGSSQLTMSLEQCNLYPTEDVKQALKTLEQLDSLGIISVPTAILDTYKAYTKSNGNAEAFENKMTDEEIKNTTVFNKIFENIYTIINEKFYSALTYCLANSALNKKYMINELWPCKALMLVLVYGLMKGDAVLCASTIHLFEETKAVSSRLKMPDFVYWLRRTKIFKADDIKKSLEYVELLKRSNLFDVPPDVETLLSGALSSPKDRVRASRSPTRAAIERALTRVLSVRGDLYANPHASAEFLGKIIKAGNENLKASASGSNRPSSSTTPKPNCQTIIMTRSMFSKFEKIFKKLKKNYKGDDPYIRSSLEEDQKMKKLKKLRKKAKR